MNLRDQLRQQADSIRQSRESRQQDAEENQRFYHAHLLPRLRAAANYFEGVVNDLGVIGPKVIATFPIGPTNAPDVQFQQDNYRFAVDDESELREVTVSCRCTLSGEITRRVGELREADKFELRLRDMGLPYHRRREQTYLDSSSESSIFNMHGGMSSGFRLTADIEGRRIQVQTRNLEDMPVRNHQLQVERFTEDLYESMVRMLLREQSQFLRTEVSEELRQQLRRQIGTSEQQSWRWLSPREQADSGERPKETPREKDGVVGRLFRKFMD